MRLSELFAQRVCEPYLQRHKVSWWTRYTYTYVLMLLAPKEICSTSHSLKFRLFFCAKQWARNYRHGGEMVEEYLILSLLGRLRMDTLHFDLPVLAAPSNLIKVVDVACASYRRELHRVFPAAKGLAL